MKKPLGRLSEILVFAGAFALLSLTACDWSAHWLAGNQREIDEATKAIAAARDDAGRAHAHSTRGRAYGERGRYSRTLRVASAEECERWFDLALEDHDRAVALAPGDARVFLDRGLTLFFRVGFMDASDPKARAMRAAAAADFTAVLDREDRNAQALDMLGVVHVMGAEFDLAIDDFTRLKAIDPKLGRLRLADAYCNRAAARQKENQADLAISDYEQAIGIGGPADSCECQSDSPLAWLYLDRGQYDKSWETVYRAQQAHRWIAPEVIDQLEKASAATPRR